jgi:hypothetical protein
MGPHALKSELKKEPFQPFRIVTTSGKTYDVTEKDRDMLLVLKGVVVIGLRVPESDPFIDRYEVVSLVHIVRLESIPVSEQQPDDDLQPEYRFDYRKARPNHFAARLKGGRRAVVLDPDVAEVFSTPESVNAVLRALIETMPPKDSR